MQIKSSLATQGLLALVTLGQNLVLIRFAPPEQYGIFVVITAAALTLAMIQNALIGSQMSVLLPALKSRPAQQRHRDAFALANLALVGLAALTGAIISLLSSFKEPLDLVAAATFTAAWLAREFVRLVNFSLFEGMDALRREALIALATLVLTAGLWFLVPPAQAMLLGGALGTFAVLAGLKGLMPSFTRANARRMKAVYRQHRANTGWAFMGAALSEFQQRAYVYTLQALLGLGAVAAVQAGRLPFGPLNILFNGFGRAARPLYAKLIADNRRREALRILAKHLAILLACNGAAALALFLAWPWIDTLIFRARYPDVERYAIGWGLMLILFQLRSTIGIFLQGERRFQALAWINMAASLICLGVLLLMLVIPDPVIAIASIAAAEGFSLIVLALLLLIPHKRALQEAGS